MRASCFRSGGLLPVLDDAMLGGCVDLSQKFASHSLKDSILYEGEIFKGSSKDLVVLQMEGGRRGVVCCTLHATPPSEC